MAFCKTLTNRQTMHQMFKCWWSSIQCLCIISLSLLVLSILFPSVLMWQYLQFITVGQTPCFLSKVQHSTRNHFLIWPFPRSFKTTKRKSPFLSLSSNKSIFILLVSCPFSLSFRYYCVFHSNLFQAQCDQICAT